jgi:hypothetical protein
MLSRPTHLYIIIIVVVIIIIVIVVVIIIIIITFKLFTEQMKQFFSQWLDSPLGA